MNPILSLKMTATKNRRITPYSRIGVQLILNQMHACFFPFNKISHSSDSFSDLSLSLLSLSFSLSHTIACVTAGPEVISPSLCFYSSAHSALPKTQGSSSTMQSLQNPTGGHQDCISAWQLSLHPTGVTVNGNLSTIFPRQGRVCGV